MKGRPAIVKRSRPSKGGKSSTTKKVPAAELAFHPLLEEIPVMDGVVKKLATDAKKAKGGQFAEKKELHQEAQMSWSAFVADIKQRGVIEPLSVVPCPKEHPAFKKGVRWLIVDGRHRFNGGTEAGLATFPVKVTKEEPASFILGALCQRNHFSKQQRAFFALHLHPELIASQRGTRTDLAAGELPVSSGKFATREVLAEAIGVHRDTVDLAARVHDLFLKDPAARRKYLPLIFGGLSLNGVLSGDGAEHAPHGGGDARQPSWMKLRDGWDRQAKTLLDNWAEVEKAGLEAQAEVKQAFAQYLTALPPALREHAQHTLAAA